MADDSAIELREEMHDTNTDDNSMFAMPDEILYPPLSAIPEFLLVISPFRRPITWSAINLLCLIWSYVLLLQFWGAGEGTRETEHGNELYLTWNFWTTTIWCIEGGLCSFYHHYNRHSMRRLDRLVDLLQFIASVYFFVDSIQLYQEWRRPGEVIYGEVTDVLISVAAYLGALIYYLSLYYEGRGRADELVDPTFCEREVVCPENQDKGDFCYTNMII